MEEQKKRIDWLWPWCLAKAFERVSLLVVWAWATHFCFPRKTFQLLCGYFEHQWRVQFEGCPAEPQDALGEVRRICPSLKLRVFVGDITALVKGMNKEVVEMANKVMKRLQEEVEEKGLKLSVTGNGKEGKSKMIASCGFLENELSQFSKEGPTLEDSVETLGVDLRTRVKRLGAKEKARRKKYKVRLSIIEKSKALRKNYMKVGVKKLLRAGMMPARTWGVHAVGMSPTERLKLWRQMAAAAGKNSTTFLSLFVETYGQEVEGELSTKATQYWAEGVWTGKWSHELKEAWMRQIREVQKRKKVRRLARAVMCETRDLGIKWPYWHTLIFGNDTKIDMQFVCPKDVKKMLVQTALFSVLEEMGSQARV